MPYLDERGHVDVWSSILGDVKKEIRYKASELILPDNSVSKKIHTWNLSPRAHLLKTASEVRGLPAALGETFEEIVDSNLKRIVQEQISPRMEFIDFDPIHRQVPQVEINEDSEPYLEDFLNSLRNDPAPAHEVDLFAFCQLSYYNYRIIYGLGPYNKMEYYKQKGEKYKSEWKRTFIPEYTEDFSIGPVPMAIRRKYFSTRMQKLLVQLLGTDELPISNIAKNLPKYEKAIQNARGLDFNGRARTYGFLRWLTYNYPDDFITLVEAHESKHHGYEIWEPLYAKIVGEDDYVKLFIYPARANPSRYLNGAYLHNRFWGGKQQRKVWGPDRSYDRLSDSDDIVDDLREAYQFVGTPGDHCRICKYIHICGGWRL